MTEKEFLQILVRHDQVQVLEMYRTLSPENRTRVLSDVDDASLKLIFRLHKDFANVTQKASALSDIKPARVIELPQSEEERQRRYEAKLLGESMLRDNTVACLLVAGGQGSRLGFPGPKGQFPISPVKKKSLFQLFCEQIKAVRLRYNTALPFLIMTSQENDAETKTFFESGSYFGLDRQSVFFFRQGTIPSITPGGALIMKDETGLFTNPDGHGGSLKALYDSGALARLASMGISDIFYFQVDNPLARIADPLFLGYHRMTDAEISTKVVRRSNTAEKVGVYVSLQDRDAIIEYSEMGEKNMSALDEKGAILYWAGNIAIHVLKRSFVERLNDHGFALPYHSAAKEIEAAGTRGGIEKVWGWKFETFIFDAIPMAHKTCCMEVRREEEFSPVKNMEGVDSPETAERDMCNLSREWLADAGITLPQGAKAEISPLLALDRVEFVKKVEGKALTVAGDIYIE